MMTKPDQVLLQRVASRRVDSGGMAARAFSLPLTIEYVVQTAVTYYGVALEYVGEMRSIWSVI